MQTDDSQNVSTAQPKCMLIYRKETFMALQMAQGSLARHVKEAERTQLTVALCCQVQKQAAADASALQAETNRALQAKDAEVQGLLADRGRLEAALASIKGQITSAASPARPDIMQNKPLVRTSVDSHTLRFEHLASHSECAV